MLSYDTDCRARDTSADDSVSLEFFHQQSILKKLGSAMGGNIFKVLIVREHELLLKVLDMAEVCLFIPR